jgi:hypothetical protein
MRVESIGDENECAPRSRRRSGKRTIFCGAAIAAREGQFRAPSGRVLQAEAAQVAEECAGERAEIEPDLAAPRLFVLVRSANRSSCCFLIRCSTHRFAGRHSSALI